MDKALKQRLVGASVLIILAVIVLPMLLSGRSDRLKHEASQIQMPPKPDELSIETRRFPVGIPNKTTPADEQETVATTAAVGQPTLPGENMDLAPANIAVQAASTPGATGDDENRLPVPDLDESQATGDLQVETQTPAAGGNNAATVTSITLASEKPASLEISAAAARDEGAPRYLVQVASFSNEKNANALADQLKADKLPVLMDVVDRPAGRMYRVRVGPYAKRPDADALVVRLGKKMKDLNPRVLDLRPDESAPVSTPSDPLVRWVVQVGSFTNPQSAEDLVAQLRLAGLNAFSEQVSAATGSVYKVRIGPELDRDKAAELARNVKTEHHLDAFVTTQE